MNKIKYMIVSSAVAAIVGNGAIAKTTWVSDDDTYQNQSPNYVKESSNKEATQEKTDYRTYDSSGFIKTSVPPPNPKTVVLEGEGLNEPTTANPVYHVNAGDTIYSISKKYGISPELLMNMNKMKSPNELRAGQKLKVPNLNKDNSESVAEVKVQNKNTSLASIADVEEYSDVKKSQGAATPSKYRIVKGDTLFSLSKRFNTSIDSIIAVNNNVKGPDDIKIGMLITIPNTSNQQQAKNSSSSVKDVATNNYSVLSNGPTESIVEKSSNPLGLKNKIDNFTWPVKGRILSKYGFSENGIKNDGINIAAPKGTPIRAVEDGKVIYVGDQLGNFGNLILVQHADSWVSAYAHTDNVMVKKGQSVRRGDTIARVGDTGNVTTSQLHFELRQNKKPVNPLDYLMGFRAELD